MLKMKIESSLMIELTETLALRSKPFSFSYGAKAIHSYQRGIQKAPNLNVYKTSLFNSKTIESTKYSIRSNPTVQKQKKLALNPFDDERMYLNEKQSLLWDKRMIIAHVYFV